MADRKSAAIKTAVLAEYRSGNTTVRGIVAALGRREITISVGSVNTYLRRAGIARRARPSATEDGLTDNERTLLFGLRMLAAAKGVDVPRRDQDLLSVFGSMRAEA